MIRWKALENNSIFHKTGMGINVQKNVICG